MAMVVVVYDAMVFRWIAATHCKTLATGVPTRHLHMIATVNINRTMPWVRKRSPCIPVVPLGLC